MLNANNPGRHKNSPDGYRQFECPIHAGRMRVTNKGFEWTYRNAGRNTPEVTLPKGTTQCCRQRYITLAPTDIPRYQKLPPGTTAHTKSMNRRLIVENGNAMNKGQWIDLERGYFQVMEHSKIRILLGFTLMALNALIAHREEQVRLLLERRREVSYQESRRQGTRKKAIAKAVQDEAAVSIRAASAKSLQLRAPPSESVD